MERKAIIDDIIELFESDEELFNEAVEELDDWNGFLDYNRYFDIELLEDVLCGRDIIDTLNMACFGRDEESWNDYSSFNPNRNYFRFNGYGNLVSADYKDYSFYLTEDLIEDLYENRYKLSVININSELEELITKLEELEELEELED